MSATGRFVLAGVNFLSQRYANFRKQSERNSLRQRKGNTITAQVLCEAIHRRANPRVKECLPHRNHNQVNTLANIIAMNL